MKLAVIGSRAYHDWDHFQKVMEPFKSKAEVVVTGGAHGPDSMAEWWAFKNRIAYRVFLPDWGKYGKGAANIRNEDIVKASDNVIAFHNGASRGTVNAMKHAAKLRIPIKAEVAYYNAEAEPINIWSNSDLPIGRYLSNMYDMRMIINGLEVLSLEGYWHYLKSGDKMYLELSGADAKQRSKAYPIGWDKVDRPRFIAKFTKALMNKCALLSMSELNNDPDWNNIDRPLQHYFINMNGDKSYQPNSWWLYLLEDIRRRSLL